MPETVGLIHEIDRASSAAKSAAIIDPKKEFVDNVYPLIRMVAEACGEVMIEHETRLGTAETAIAEMATMGDSIVLPELAHEIDVVLALGLQLCSAVEDGVDLEAVGKICPRYRGAVEALRAELDDVTVETDDDTEEESDN